MPSEDASFGKMQGEVRRCGELVAASRRMGELFQMAARVSTGRYPVLICGETGTGKGLLARAIHDLGPFADKPFVPIDCPSIAATLAESELFGHVRGAFTGAVADKSGLFQAAGDGTAFLDEIAELPIELQAKLLRVLQEKECRPVGSNRYVRVNARVLAATSRDLTGAVRHGKFRSDLYYRLNVVTLDVPPLRERKVDIPLLADRLLGKHSADPRYRFSTQAMDLLLLYSWPGNVRELENCVQHALAVSPDFLLTAQDLPSTITSAPAIQQGLILTLRELERRAILHALAATGGNKLSAARLLGIGKSTIYRKLKEARS